MVPKCPSEPTKFGDEGHFSQQTLTGSAITRLTYQGGLVAMLLRVFSAVGLAYSAVAMLLRVFSAVGLAYSGCPGKADSEVASHCRHTVES